MSDDFRHAQGLMYYDDESGKLREKTTGSVYAACIWYA